MDSQNKTYKDINRSILVAIPNPSSESYEIKTKVPELTFLGVQEQPDFATYRAAGEPTG